MSLTAQEARERPILFSAPMVRAVLRDIDPKQQTRRVVKHHVGIDPHWAGGGYIQNRARECCSLRDAALLCPYGKPGDRLWVREAWRAELTWDAIKPSDIPAEAAIWYEADRRHRNNGLGAKFKGKQRPSMFMPRWASRITLEVTGVRVERLQDISEADAIAEGLTQTASGSWLPGPCDYPEWAYHQLWEQINGPGSWEANPLVWVVGFKRLEVQT